jgi:hypothetical protein
MMYLCIIFSENEMWNYRCVSIILFILIYQENQQMHLKSILKTHTKNT